MAGLLRLLRKPTTTINPIFATRTPVSRFGIGNQLRLRVASGLQALQRCGGLLKEYAHDRGVLLMGDLPFFVSLDSSDVWSNPEWSNSMPIFGRDW
jgi:hypothetical protein